MKYLDRPSLVDILLAVADRFDAWWRRESGRATLRLWFWAAVILLLGLLGPLFIKLPIFPDRPTAVRGTPEQLCVYDASPVPKPDRYSPPPTPSPIVVGTAAVYHLPIVNSGTCTWGSDVTLVQEGGTLPTDPLRVITVTETAATFLYTAPISYTAPFEAGVYDSIWRMRTPRGETFGPPLTFSIVTHLEGEQPAYPGQFLSFGDILAFVFALAPGVAGFILALNRSGAFIREFYNLKRKSTGPLDLDPPLRLIFNLGSKPGATARKGLLEVTEQDKEIDDMGGPGILSVHSGTAVVLERVGAFSRIVGPGSYALGTFERVRRVIDLRPLSRTRTESARTKDGIEVSAEATVTFQLMEQMEGEELPKPKPRTPLGDLIAAWLGFRVPEPRVPGGPPASLEAIRAIVYDLPAGGEWDKSVSSGLSGVIPQKMLDELWAPDDPDRNPRRELVEELFQKGRERYRKSGIRLIDLNIGALIVNDEIVKLRREWWQAFWKKDGRITEAEGNAEALQVRERERLEAQTRMIQAILLGVQGLEPIGRDRLSQVIALRFIDTIESIASVWLYDENRADYLKVLNVLNDLRQLSSSSDEREEPHKLSTPSKAPKLPGGSVDATDRD